MADYRREGTGPASHRLTFQQSQRIDACGVITIVGVITSVHCIDGVGVITIVGVITSVL